MTAVALVIGGLGVAAGPAAAAACDPTIPEVGSLDGGGGPDVPVGMPDLDELDVNYSAADQRNLKRADLTALNIPARFGAAMTTIDTDRDGCSELIVGAPGETAEGERGAFVVLKGSDTGLTTAGAVLETAPTAGDGFGATLASASRYIAAQPWTDSTVDLWVGAPNRTVRGVVGAGAVDHYVFDNTGSLSLLGTLTAYSLGGKLYKGAHFGAALNARGINTVAIGAPGDTVGGHGNAGSVWQFRLTDGGFPTQVKHWTQNSKGFPGAAETGDRFGYSLAGATTLLVGTPYEDIGKATNTGMVTAITASGKVTNYTQDSPGVPGADETGDHFGAALTTGTWLSCQEVSTVAVGVPGENIGSTKDAGSVVLMPSKGCAGALLTQGRGKPLGGLAETGDAVGSALTVLRGRDDFDEDVRDRLVIGAPGESVGSAAGAGVVAVRGDHTVTTYTYAGSSSPHRKYGAVLAVPGGGYMYSN
ncbi:hypothetical protein ACIB24_04760 [Spongisporangium articulatum]|uniref:FG-GAP repeat protein n=1 Tax=Spongisporangium articulatum TaxID=3362603 RepID=A0ABW8AJ22_9ACTN